MIRSSRIQKAELLRPSSSAARLSPHLVDYARHRAAFRWQDARAQLAGRATSD